MSHYGYFVDSDSDIAHYGVKGMKWGIRKDARHIKDIVKSGIKSDINKLKNARKKVHDRYRDAKIDTYNKVNDFTKSNSKSRSEAFADWGKYRNAKINARRKYLNTSVNNYVMNLPVSDSYKRKYINALNKGDYTTVAAKAAWGPIKAAGNPVATGIYSVSQMSKMYDKNKKKKVK